MRRLLLRHYIQRSLYDPIHGYFSNAIPPIVKHNTALQLPQIPSRTAYQAAVTNVYAEHQHGWMTPVELFSPYFSNAIANRLESVAPVGNDKINIIEIGAGRGTLARDIFNLWSQNRPDLLPRVTYNIIEISSSLARLQSKVLQPWIKSGHIVIHKAHCLQWFAEQNSQADFHDSHYHIIGMEVLDNLPHDLIREADGVLQQAKVVFDQSTLSRDASRGILEWSTEIDSLTCEAINAHGIIPSNSTPAAAMNPTSQSPLSAFRSQFEKILNGGVLDFWVPTVSYQLLREIIRAFPQAYITLGDFHSFPGALSGQNGPIVQRVERGNAIVYDSVHGAPFGEVDIMFPTDFHQLQQGYCSLSSKSPFYSTQRTVSQSDFFHHFSSDLEKSFTTCQDGFNPILEDFENASLFLVDSVGNSS